MVQKFKVDWDMCKDWGWPHGAWLAPCTGLLAFRGLEKEGNKTLGKWCWFRALESTQSADPRGPFCEVCVPVPVKIMHDAGGVFIICIHYTVSAWSSQWRCCKNLNLRLWHYTKFVCYTNFCSVLYDRGFWTAFDCGSNIFVSWEKWSGDVISWYCIDLMCIIYPQSVFYFHFFTSVHVTLHWTEKKYVQYLF